MDKVYVKLYVPLLEAKYDVWIPANKRISNVIFLLVKSINEMNEGCFKPHNMPAIYDKITAEKIEPNLTIKESTIRSGAELILI